MSGLNPETATLLVELIRGIRAGLTVAKEVGVNYTEVAKDVAAVEAAGGTYSVEDAHKFLEQAGASIAKLDEDLAATK